MKPGYYQIKTPRYCPVIIFIGEASTLSHPHVLGVAYYGLLGDKIVCLTP